MNTLSLLLLLADVAPKIGGIGLAVALLITIIAVVNIFGVAFQEDHWSFLTEKQKQEIVDAKANLARDVRRRYAIPIIVGLLFFALLPSKATIYLVAGSEAGEVVVMSEAGQAILDDVQAVIRAQLRLAGADQ